MNILNDDLFSKLLNNKKARQYADFKITARGGDLETFLTNCDANAKYYAGKTGMGYKTKKTAQFLTFADYLTYVPYGSEGYKKLEEILKAQGMGQSVANFRFEKLKTIMGDDLTNLPKEQIDYIRNFFLNYNKDTVNSKDIAEVTALICRVHHEVEANYGNPGYTDVLTIKNHLNEICYKIGDLGKEKDTIESEEFLKTINKPSLGKEDIEHIQDVSGLEKNPSVKQP